MNTTNEILHESCTKMLQSINFGDASFKIALFFVAFNPLFWNFVSRLEYHTHIITKITKNPRRGCYVFAATIFTLGIIRDYFFNEALNQQGTFSLIQSDFSRLAGVLLIGFGQLLVLTSMYKLGIVGTYCGDYFGILMKDKITDFPFNVVNNPMYRGSTLTFLGFSLLYGKIVGVVISFFVHIVYEIAIKIEEPFTTKIYATKNQKGQ